MAEESRRKSQGFEVGSVYPGSRIRSVGRVPLGDTLGIQDAHCVWRSRTPDANGDESVVGRRDWLRRGCSGRSWLRLKGRGRWRETGGPRGPEGEEGREGEQPRGRATPIKPADRNRIDITRRGVSRNGASQGTMIGHTALAPSRAFSAFALLLFAVCLLSQASGEYETREAASGGSNERTADNEFRSCTDGKCIKRTTEEVTGGMWFGPRLGRRRRSDSKLEVDPEIEALANVLDGTRWAVITIPGGDKRQPTQFTPRLGRESGEEFLTYGEPREPDDVEIQEEAFPPFFAPRLGRRLPWTPSPRLGRHLRGAFDRPRHYSGESRF
ncbi:hypothetical protein KM043_004860 [Ampulex compressa]|nr:hypothetical protein KM043_004860 [Ampulex compressa]